MESIILTILPINMEMIKLPSQIKQALGSFCCLIKRILELKQGTENVIIISMTISCTASKVPLPARDNSVAEPKSRLRMLSTKRLAASFGRWRNPSIKGPKASDMKSRIPKWAAMLMMTLPPQKGNAVSATDKNASLTIRNRLKEDVSLDILTNPSFNGYIREMRK